MCLWYFHDTAHQIASYIAHILNVYSLPSGSYWLTEFGLWMNSVIKPSKSSDINILSEEETRRWSNYKPEEKWVMTMNVTKRKKKWTAVMSQRTWICFVSLPIISIGLLCTCLKMAKGVYFIPWFGEKTEETFMGRGGMMNLENSCVESIAWWDTHSF